MVITETGPGYFKVKDVIPGLEDMNPHAWFKGPPALFQLPRYSRNLAYSYSPKLYQFTIKDPEVRKLADQVVLDCEELGLTKDLPEYKISYCLHEINGEDAAPFIPCHTDTDHLVGFTIFLNRSWHRTHGGWNMMIDTNGDPVATIPEFNTGIFIFTPCEHFTVPLFNPVRRRTMQIFFDERKERP